MPGCSQTRIDSLQFTRASVVTFSLDLTGGGILFASVDDGPITQLLNNYHFMGHRGGAHYSEGVAKAGLVPAVWLTGAGTVRILDFMEE